MDPVGLGGSPCSQRFPRRRGVKRESGAGFDRGSQGRLQQSHGVVHVLTGTGYGVKPAAIIDIDGTLVDSNYQHAMAWFQAFAGVGITVEIRKLHRLVGMGGDKIVAAAAGEAAERDHGDEVRARHRDLFDGMIDSVALLPGARELVRRLAEGSRGVVLASSARAEEVEHYLDLLDVRDDVLGWTTAADVDATKPDADLLEAALDLCGRPAVMVGDSTWDCVAAKRATLPAVAVLTGGYGRDELVEAGAVAVHDSAAALAERLADPPFLLPG